MTDTDAMQEADEFGEMADKIVAAMVARGAITTGELIARINEEKSK